MLLCGCPCSSGTLAKDWSVVSNKLSSRAALPGPGAVATAGEAAGLEPYVFRFQMGGPLWGMAPARPDPGPSPKAELPKAADGMLAVMLAAEREPAGAMELCGRAEGPMVRSERRLLMAASRDAFEDSGRVLVLRFLEAFFGRGKEELAPGKGGSLAALTPAEA